MPPSPLGSTGARRLGQCLGLLLVFAACQSREDQACDWPRALDRRDSDNSCVASPFLLQCALPPGAPLLCTTSKPDRCSANADADCQPVCAEGEYAVSCGRSDGKALPDGCRPAIDATPELGFFCCACQ